MRRPAALTAAILFLLSWIFPLAAGLASASALPKWWGPVDVVLAFIVVISGFAIYALVRDRVDRQAEDLTYRVYRVVTHGLMLVAVVIIFAGDRIIWINCATGFLWRAWLGLYLLPWWLTAWRSPRPLN